jgi:hypothetical protein
MRQDGGEEMTGCPPTKNEERLKFLTLLPIEESRLEEISDEN